MPTFFQSQVQEEGQDVDSQWARMVQLVVGALAGWFAAAVLWPRRQLGLLFGVVLGILGASLGGIIFTVVRFPASTEFRAFPVAGLFPVVPGFSAWSILVAFVTALVLLGLLRLVSDIRAMKLPR